MDIIRKIELEEKQSKLFLMFNDSKYNTILLINLFMRSDLAKEIDRDFSNTQLCPLNIWYETIATENIENSNTHYNNDAIEWLGYFYRKWHYLTGEPSKNIVRYLPPLDGIKNYYTYHQLSDENIIDIAKEKYNTNRNNQRKYIVKKNKNIFKDFIDKDNVYYSFLAKRILSKLLNKKLKNARFIESNNTFVNKNKVFLCTSNISSKENTSINDLIRNVKFKNLDNYDQSIHFIFAFSKKYEFDSLENLTLENDINKFIDKNIAINFSNIYIYSFGKMYEINKAREIKKYFAPISKRDKLTIRNEINLFKAYDEIEQKLHIKDFYFD